jgi:hypothetical protein
MQVTEPKKGRIYVALFPIAQRSRMETVYLETTFLSYLVARPSRDLIVAGHQQITQEWWANRHSEFECSGSQSVRQKNSWEVSGMWEDPIVAEVDRTREMLAAKFKLDVEAIFADIRTRQAALGERLVPQRTRPEPKPEADRSRHPGSPEATSADAAPAA